MKRLSVLLVVCALACVGASWAKHRWVVQAQTECRHTFLPAIVALEARSLLECRTLDLGDGFNPDQNGSLARRPAHRYLYAFGPEVGGLVTHDDGGVSEPRRALTHVPACFDANASERAVTGHGPDALYGVSSDDTWALWPPWVLAELGPRGRCPDCSITVGCIANLDGDATPDVWTVSSADRRREALLIPAGTPWHEVDDDDWPWSLLQ